MSDLFFVPAALVALLVTTTFMVALRPIAEKMGLIDHPGGRKRHVGTVPIIGGIAMFIGMFAGLSLAHVPLGLLSSVFLASSLLLIIGVFDDRVGMSVKVRVAMQITVALILVYGAGLELHNIGEPFGNGPVLMGDFTLLFTAVVTITMINAYNLIDGADGLAGTLALIALLAVAIVAGGSSVPGAIALTISASILGFLAFNLPVAANRPMLTFMGDAGSTLLGFTIVWVTIGITQGPDRLISPVHCLWFASIPIYDCLTCFVRRVRRGKSPMTPGRDHFHHVLQRGGFGVRQKLAILTGLQFVYASIGLVGHFAGVPDVVMFTAWSVLGLSQRSLIVGVAKRHRYYQIRKYLPAPA